MPVEMLPSLLLLIFLTHARYQDRPSRIAILQVLREINHWNAELFQKAMVALLVKEADKAVEPSSYRHSNAADTTPPCPLNASSRFVMLSWINLVITLIAESADSTQDDLRESPVFAKAVQIQALLLYSLRFDTKKTMINSAYTDTRRCIRATRKFIPTYFSLLFSTSQTCNPLYRNAILISTIVDTCFRLRPKSLGEQLVEDVKNQLSDYYINTIISSKTDVPTVIVTSFYEFFNRMVSEEMFIKDYVPVLDKMLLRSPDTALSVLASTVHGLSFDPSSLFADKWLDPLLNHLCSTALSVRYGAVMLWGELVKTSHQLESLSKVATETNKVLLSAKANSWEVRDVLYQMLSQLSDINAPSVSQKVLDGYFTMMSKESNEKATSSAVQGIGKHLAVLIHNDEYAAQHKESIDKAIKVSSDGLSTTKAQNRKGWAVAVGSTFWAQKNASKTLNSNAIKYLQALFTTFDKIADKPLAWKDGPLEAYILVAVVSGRIEQWSNIPVAITELLKKHKYPSSLQTTTPKPSFLLWDRIFTKAVTPEEGLWLVRALTSSFLNESQATLEKTSAGYLYAQALIWTMTSHPEHTIRRAAYEEVSTVSKQKPEMLCAFMKQALKQWLLDIEHKSKDSTAVNARSGEDFNIELATYRLASVLNGITSFDDTISNETKNNELIELMVLAHHKYIASPTNKYNWITMIQKVNVDPGKLVNTHFSQVLEILKDRLAARKQSELFYQAALSSISTLAFISPQCIPTFVDLVKTHLDTSLMKGITTLEHDIWKTPEDQVFVDVLKKNTTVSEHRNKKGYADQKWEEELRAELAKKKGISQTQKLTKEEQLALDTQRKKERDIRTHVQSVHDKMTLGLHVVRALVVGNVETLSDHLSVLVPVLLNIATKNAGLLVGQEITDTYIDLGRCITHTIAPIREAIGLATLRVNNVDHIPSQWLDEPLGDVVARVLYRLRFITENQPLDPSSFAYCLPLLHQALSQGGIECVDAEDDENDSVLDQITMVIDIISFHCSEGNSSSLPRKDMIESLLYSIKEYPQCSKSAKLALVSLCEAMSTTVTLEEINVLLQGLLSDNSIVRHTALQGLEFFDLTDIDYSPELWLICHDTNETNAELGRLLWEENAMEVEETYKAQLLTYTVSESTFTRTAASKAISEAMKLYPDTIVDTLEDIYKLYKKMAAPLDPKFDQYGMVIQETLNRQDPWVSRSGLATALKVTAAHASLEHALSLSEFLVRDEALGDRHEGVRKLMVEAGLAAINTHGKQSVQEFLSIYENYLNTKAPNNQTHDFIRQSAVILYGGAAGYLQESDPKVRTAVDKLIETLDTPSEVVQSAVAECLPPLIKMIKEEVPTISATLLQRLFKSSKYAERRGAAYGLAGLVKGRGIVALKECSIMAQLKEAIDLKRSYEYKQGSLFAFETLSATLGRLFEPYIIQVIPLLLVCFGDTNLDVREATSDTARVIMSKISGHCVKLILPSILTGLDDRQWRTKKASVELLGAMAYCAPKQLSVSLPNIIPRITEVLADTHPQVQTAANRSLYQFGEVISNPEIQELVPVLLEALSDPNTKTMSALSALLRTSFVHYIDPPSLALVMPILERGLRERGTEVKTKAAQIVGNMASLTNQKDLVPYLPLVLPGVKAVLTDPVPDARGTAAKALGCLVEKMGESNFVGLVPELLDTLKTDTGSVDRQGAAQGLSEVLAGLGLERLDGLLPEIISNSDSPRAYVREGFISLLIYLPATFGTRFQPYLGRIIPPILVGLADESEFVREASLRAGRMIVTNYATKAVDLLLPELEKGLFDNNWRIRQSSVQLVGDLLFRITGTAGPKNSKALGNFDEIKPEDDGDEDFGADEGKKKQLLDLLGKERRDRILAALYIVRQDASGIVRQASLLVWKSLVANTPRTLKDILSTIMSMIIKNLSSENYEQRAVAGRTLSELVTKLGESVFTETLPLLEEGMVSSDENIRTGVTVAFSEVMAGAGKVQVLDFADRIIPTIRTALCDPSDEVREAAAQAFDTLHQNVGAKAIDDILPSLLHQLQSSDDSSAYALSALKEIMAVRSNVVFPVLIPTLLTVPITAFNARALASLVTVAGPALNRRLTTILSALVESRIIEEDEEVIEQLKNTLKALMASIEDEEGLDTLITSLQDYARDGLPEKRAYACELVDEFYSDGSVDGTEYVSGWIDTLTLLLGDRVAKVVPFAWSALNAVTKSVPKDEYEELVIPVRRAILRASVPGCDLAGFCLPKGISPVLPIFLQGLMYGSTESRELSALAIGELIDRTSADALKPFVTQITGPLIRIAGDRHPSQVKAAILQTLCLLLTKVPMYLRPFMPQLQRTFTKAISDATDDTVREHAEEALELWKKIGSATTRPEKK
ncbi:armadillo-type protein [Spinellus fusiger]|nr:armadillo-type protein [Spinellus fusiger]